ncbi:histidine kinase [Arthrobacter sp. BF1]|uniref:sensor histidine kinase n=1 Tax=Arthrobacter sp. BF1 TaxID=2821145 RepID=UPI001C4F7119
MTESTRPHSAKLPRVPISGRTFKLAELLRVGSSPLSPWLAFAFAVFVTVSAFDDVRLSVQTSPGGQLPWLWISCTVAYWTVWMALAFRPQWVAALFVLQLATMLPQAVIGGPLLLAFVAIAVAAYRASLRALAIMVGSFLVWQVIWVLFVAHLGMVQLWGYIPATLLITAPGLAIKLLRERALQVARDQKAADETAARAAVEQRAELARELHDVVTHGLTMIAVQANLGKISKEELAKEHALTEIGAMARNSLNDLRRLIVAMRTEEAHAQDAGPQPSVACIDLELSFADTQKQLSGLGCPTHIKTSGDLDQTPNGIRPTVLRILQESATNIVKHSGNGARCEISMDVATDHLELVIRNRMTPGKPRLPVSGTGLAGLQERASRLGGTLESGPDGGWWRVHAILPFKDRQSLH